MKNIIIFFSVILISYRLNAQNFWEPIIGSPDSVLSIAIDTSRHIFAGTTSGIFRSTDNGDSWVAINNGLPVSKGWSPIVIGPDGNLFAAHSDLTIGYLYRSTNNGESWAKSDSGMINPQTYDIVFASNGDIFLSSYLVPIESGNSITFGVFISHDNGVTWSLTSYPSQYPCTIKINAQGDIFVGDRIGVYRSTDQGQSWSVSNFGGIDFNTISINSLGHILAISFFGWGMWLSTDNGANWALVNNGSLFRAIINQHDELFGCHYSSGWTTHHGVYKSTNNGYDWLPVNEGLTDLDVYSHAIDKSGFIYVGTPTGIFRSTNSTTSVEFDHEDVPTSFKLLQNYPNPFNPSTTINFSIPASGLVTLKVFNALGSEVATLVNEQKEPGSYQVEFEADNYSTGIYFYNLQAGSYVETRKMLLLK